MSKTYDERLKEIYDELDRNWINGMKEGYQKAADYLSKKDVLQVRVPLSDIVAPIHWRDPQTEKPEDGEMVLIREYYKSPRYGKFVNNYRVFTYLERFGFDLEENINHFCKNYRITHWMRIPPIE